MSLIKSNGIKEDRNILITLIIYTFLLLFFISKMSPLYPTNEWADINLYFNLGKAAFNGHTIYSEAFDHKGPLIFIIYGIGYLISNSSFLGVYIIQSIFWTLMVFAAYYTARLYLDKIYAFITAVLFPVFISTHTSQGGSAEEFVAVFAVISMFLFISYFKDSTVIKHKPAEMLVHGILFAAVIFIKINLAIFWFFPIFAIFLNILLNKEYKNLIHNIAAFIVGILVVTLPFIIYFAVNNSLAEAWDIYIILNRSYAEIGTLPEIIEQLVVRFYLRLRFEPFDFIIILTGAIWFPLKYIENKLGRIAIICSFFAVFCVIFITPKFLYYYTILYYIFGLLGFIVICRHIKLDSKWYIYAICAALALYWGISKKNFFGYEIKDLLGDKQKITVYSHFENIIGSEDNPTLMNMGLDENNVIFTRLNIMPNVKYFTTPNITYDMYPDMRNTQTEYVKNKEVQFIILPQKALYFDYFYDSTFLNENYNLIDTYVDDMDKFFLLYKRKD